MYTDRGALITLRLETRPEAIIMPRGIESSSVNTNILTVGHRPAARVFISFCSASGSLNILKLTCITSNNRHGAACPVADCAFLNYSPKITLVMMSLPNHLVEISAAVPS